MGGGWVGGGGALYYDRRGWVVGVLLEGKFSENPLNLPNKQITKSFYNSHRKLC